MKTISKRIDELFRETIQMRSLDLSKTDFEQAKKIREIEQEKYDKCVFFKNMRDALEKSKSSEGENEKIKQKR